MQHPIDINKARRKLRDNPRQVLANARNGVRQDLLDVANFWNLEGPTMLSFGAIGVLFHHLDADKTPVQVTPENLNLPETRNAWFAFTGLSKLGNFFNEDVNPEIYDSEILAAWPGCSNGLPSFTLPTSNGEVIQTGEDTLSTSSPRRGTPSAALAASGRPWSTP
ncbi:hypothetical protein CC2G_012531 [Coprinopsis cinerea AmutBmut pab1-1]|nr:hypothetical protein CC2G_012531 [Coprinopsis cinerea AmutBmut pab1-1]